MELTFPDNERICCRKMNADSRFSDCRADDNNLCRERIYTSPSGEQSINSNKCYRDLNSSDFSFKEIRNTHRDPSLTRRNHVPSLPRSKHHNLVHDEIMKLYTSNRMMMSREILDDSSSGSSTAGGSTLSSCGKVEISPFLSIIDDNTLCRSTSTSTLSSKSLKAPNKIGKTKKKRLSAPVIRSGNSVLPVELFRSKGSLV
uniref:Uncharacterized protein n=3 Tax=Corethron hystrix TaxID=216773 RepID=A0A7S1FWN8_9STRA|mmetsp:Transcript_38051/g.88530  ORF Transcript_38051/g.88530 Transcript_38051/m.88530 type:complete len:201 (+) Transcript_38051:300-902(+)